MYSLAGRCRHLKAGHLLDECFALHCIDAVLWCTCLFLPLGHGLLLPEYEKRKGSQVARHHIKDHRAKQLLVVPNDDKFVAVAAPEAFSRHSGTCMILGGQASFCLGGIRDMFSAACCVFVPTKRARVCFSAPPSVCMYHDREGEKTAAESFRPV